MSGPRAHVDSDSAKVLSFRVVGYIKGKSAIRAARDFMGRHQSFKGYHFWARGFFVSTVGIDEDTIRKCICDQEKNDQKLDQRKLS